MTLCFNSKGNHVKTYDEWQRGLPRDVRVSEDDEEVFTDGSLMGEDE
jgi:hypothetical protein